MMNTTKVEDAVNRAAGALDALVEALDNAEQERDLLEDQIKEGTPSDEDKLKEMDDKLDKIFASLKELITPKQSVGQSTAAKKTAPMRKD